MIMALSNEGLQYLLLLERERRNKEERQGGQAIQMTKCSKKTRQVLDNMH
jgi:hypothetical protein